MKAIKLNTVFNFFKTHLTKKRLIILVIVLTAAGGIFIFTQRNRQKPIDYTEVKIQNITSTVSSSGVLAGKDTANLRFKIPGKLAFINFKDGDQVLAFQTIATLDSQELNIQLKQAKNILDQKQAELDKVLDDIHLFQYGNGGFANVGSPNETMTQKAARTAAEKTRDNAYQSVQAIVYSLRDTILISPISGIITKADFLPGQVISPTDVITQIVDTNEYFFDAEIDESDIAKIKLGQKAKITLNSYPDKKFSGSVNQIKPITKTASSGATVVIVRILLENADFAFISDLNGQAEIEVGSTSNVLTIPTDALVDEKYVYIKTNTGFEKREVKIGISSDSDIEIKEGLKEKDQVVKNPANIPNKQ